MLHPPGFYFVKKPKRFVILSSDKSSERNLSCFFDIKKPKRLEHLQSEEPFSSDPYFRIESYNKLNISKQSKYKHIYFFNEKMKEGRRAGGITAGPESKVLEGNDWEAPMQDGKTVVDHVDYKVCYLI